MSVFIFVFIKNGEASKQPPTTSGQKSGGAADKGLTREQEKQTRRLYGYCCTLERKTATKKQLRADNARGL